MNPSRTLFSSTLTANISRTASRGLNYSAAIAYGIPNASILRPLTVASARNFSTSRRSQLEYFPPAKNAPNIKLTPPQWKHAGVTDGVTEEQLKGIEVAHRDVRNMSDRVAYNMVRVLRWGTDLATGYRHDPNKPYTMTERKWMVRFIFLETVAGVPGMMAAMVRHFHSLRRLKRDNGW